MTEPYTISVRPSKSTALEAEFPGSVRLPGYELWTTFIKNVHIIPITLGIERFAQALGETLRAYPHTAGRLRRGETEWQILLDDPVVPLEIERRDALDLGLKDRRVIVDDISEFLSRGARNELALRGLSPLLHIRLTTSKSETAIGVSWHHTLGDAALLLRFMHHLSQTYQSLPIKWRTPTFEKYNFPCPNNALIEEYLPLMPHVAASQPLSQIGSLYGKMNAHTARVDFHFTQDQLSQLRAKIMHNSHMRSSDIEVSKQDCLTAYLITTINAFLDVPIRKISNAATYRHTLTSFVDPNVAGNAIYIIPSTTAGVQDIRSLCDMALLVRRSINQCRKPEFVQNYMAVASHLMLKAANADRAMFFAAPPGTMSVNSNLSLDWLSIHFGCPGRVRFHTSGVNDRYVRVFRSNPQENDADSQGSEDGVDVCLALAEHIRTDVMTTISSHWKHRVLEL